jgi:hypothetical protein
MLCDDIGEQAAVEWSYEVFPDLDDFTWKYIATTIICKRQEGVTGTRLDGEHPDQDPDSISGTSTLPPAECDCNGANRDSCPVCEAKAREVYGEDIPY